MLADNCRQVQDPVFQLRQFNAAIKSEQNGIFFHRLYEETGHKNAGRSQVNHILNWDKMAFCYIALELHTQQKNEKSHFFFKKKALISEYDSATHVNGRRWQTFPQGYPVGDITVQLVDE